jgi:four helix bundle protein
VKGREDKSKSKTQKLKMAQRSDLDERTLEYGTRIIKVVESLPKTLVGRTIGDQVLRSGLSVGANFQEAQGAESRADFTHKLQIALKEVRETTYWLHVIAKAEVLPWKRLASLIDEPH